MRDFRACKNEAQNLAVAEFNLPHSFGERLLVAVVSSYYYYNTVQQL